MRLSALLCAVLALPGLLGSCRSTNGKASAAASHDLVFEGNHNLSAGRLTEIIQLDLQDFERAGYRKAYIDDAAYDIEIGYRDVGFPFATATYAIEGLDPPNPPKRVRFEIVEGPRTVLRDVEFRGMQQLTRANFDRALSSRRAPVLQGGLPYYVERDILSALSTLERQYVELGYLDAELKLLSTEFNEERDRASIVIEVSEGERFEVGDVEVSDEGESTPAELLAACREAVASELQKTERVFQQRTGYELRGRLIELLEGRGHADAVVRLEQKRRPDEPVVDIRLTVVAGPRVRITEVRFPEDLSTRKRFLRSRMRIEEGDVYDSEKVRESIRRLYATGLFTRVAVDVEQGEGEERALVVSLEEARTGEVFFEPGYGSYERTRIGLGFRKRNLWGMGRLLRVEATLAELAQRATITLTDPWFFGTPLSADIALRYDRRKLPSFTEQDLGAGIFWTREWNVVHATSFGYQYRLSRATDILLVDDAVEEAQNTLNVSSVQVSQRMDSRDNFFLPSRGWYNEASVELGDETLGSELDFLRTSLRTSSYASLRKGTVLAGAFRTGVIFPIGQTETIPIQERYFNGGQNAVRSFRFDELGPKDASGKPVGGEAFATANIELRQDLSTRFQGAVFLDAGNVTPDHEDYLDFRDVQLGLGVGLRYLLAIGPVRLDVGWNPDPEPGDPDYVVHFSIGMAF